jgi:hypothetical protein
MYLHRDALFYIFSEALLLPKADRGIEAMQNEDPEEKLAGTPLCPDAECALRGGPQSIHPHLREGQERHMQERRLELHHTLYIYKFLFLRPNPTSAINCSGLCGAKTHGMSTPYREQPQGARKCLH